MVGAQSILLLKQTISRHLDPNEWADMFAAAGAKYDDLIYFEYNFVIFLFYLGTLFSTARLVPEDRLSKTYSPLLTKREKPSLYSRAIVVLKRIHFCIFAN